MTALETSATSPARTATLALDRCIRTAALYEGKGPLCESALSGALSALHAACDEQPWIDIEVHPSGLVVAGDTQVPDETRSASFQIFRDGLRTVTLDADLDAEALQGLVAILADPFQRWGTGEDDEIDTLTTERDEDTVTRLWEADLQGVRFQAVEAYSEREMELDGERLSFQDWVQRRVEALQRPVAAPSEAPSMGGTTPFTPFASPDRDVRAAHRGHEDRDRLDDVPRRLVVLARLPDADTPEGVDRMVLGLLGCLESGSWRGLGLGLDIVEATLPERGARTVLSQLLTAAHGATIDAAIRRLQGAEAPTLVAVLGRLGVDVAARVGGLLTDHGKRDAVEAVEAALDEAGQPAVGLYTPQLALESTVAAWAVERLGARHRREPADPEATAALRGALDHRHPGTRLLAFKALEGDQHPDTHAALLSTLASDDRHLLKHCLPQIQPLVERPDTAGDATAAVLSLVEDDGFWDRPAPVRRLLVGLLGSSVDPAAEAWATAFLGRRVLFFGRAALQERQDFVRRALGPGRSAS